MKKFLLLKMTVFSFIILLLVVSCTRSAVENTAQSLSKARPAAILQTGRHPLWFQLTERGPQHIESIGDALLPAAVPWPLALHIRFFQKKNDELVIAVNRYGLLKMAPYDDKDHGAPIDGIALYCFSGGNFWQRYSVGGLVFYENQSAALLYLDDRFLDSSLPLPSPRTWTFNMESNLLFPLTILALELFPAEEGWDIDALRLISDGLWYYRVRQKNVIQPKTLMFQTTNLMLPGQEIEPEIFYSSFRAENKLPQNLPLLPDGFVYTGAAIVGDSIFACWEEQKDFFIGAAGFMMMKLKP